MKKYFGIMGVFLFVALILGGPSLMMEVIKPFWIGFSSTLLGLLNLEFENMAANPLYYFFGSFIVSNLLGILLLLKIDANRYIYILEFVVSLVLSTVVTALFTM